MRPDVEQFIARQPIFDVRLKVYAYELLFRSGLDNYFSHHDGDQASASIIVNSLLLFGMETMTGGSKAFINFTRKLLIDGSATLLPKQITVVEILEDVEPDDAIVAACQKLKHQGFTLALDDFVAAPKFEPLIKIADFVKVDFLDTSPEQRAVLAKDLVPRGVKLLAEKVETQEEMHEARDLGYTYFQGYFFAKPVIVSRKDIPSNKVQQLQVLQEINRPDMDFKELARLISSDVALSFKLLRYINSAAFSLLTEVSSIEQALNLLGEREIRQWASLITLASMGQDKPAELVATSVVRATLAEALAPKLGHTEQSGDYFMMGLFSLLDTFFGRPLDEVLAELPIGDDIKSALLEQAGEGGTVLGLVEALETGDWPVVAAAADELGLDLADLPEAHYQAVRTSRDILGLSG